MLPWSNLNEKKKQKSQSKNKNKLANKYQPEVLKPKKNTNQELMANASYTLHKLLKRKIPENA